MNFMNVHNDGLHVSPDLMLPLDAVTETFAILAKRRAGKSNAAVVFAEELFSAGLPWVAVDPKGDWYGVRSSKDGRGPGLAVVVFGGLHGDVTLHPAAGSRVATLIAEQRLTAILDVSEMSKAEQRRFLTDFAETLYRANREPLQIFAEEADAYIPQRVTAGDARMVGAWETLVKRGGFRGLGVTLISQRSASLNKDVLSQVETLIALRTTAPQDRKAILGWVDQHVDGAEAVSELPSLDNGSAWVFSPHWLNRLTKVQFRRRSTFDSGATPKVGARPRPPATLAQVNIAAIVQALEDPADVDHGDKPTAKRQQQIITELRRELKAAQQAQRPRPVEVPALSQATVAALQATVQDLSHGLEQYRAVADAANAAADRAAAQLSQVKAELARVGTPASPTSRTARSTPARSTPPAKRPPSTEPQGSNAVSLRRGADRMVQALGRMAPLRLTKSQWGTVAKLKTSGGTWSTYLSDIRRAGFLDESSAGYTLTDAGFAYLGGQPEPMTAEELQQHYRLILRSGATKMLDALIESWPATLTRDEVGARADLATTGGTFATYLSDLVRNGLAERDADGAYRATDVLMMGAQSDL